MGGGSGSGGGSSPAPSYSGGGNDGGGGGSRPAPRPKPKPTPKPKPKPKPQPVEPKPEPGTSQYLDSGSGESGKPTMQVSDGGGGEGASQYIGATSGGDLTGADRSVTKFIAGEGEGSKAEAMEKVLGQDPLQQYFGTSPFNRAGIERGEGYLGTRLATTTEVPGLDATVENQPNAPEVGGGEVGIGAQGFGNRALVGGEGQIVSAEGAESNAVNTAIPAENAPSDLAKDPAYQAPMPGKAFINDYNFSLPFFRNPNMVGFRRGGPMAASFARGPISRGLMSARSGFGRRFF